MKLLLNHVPRSGGGAVILSQLPEQPNQWGTLIQRKKYYKVDK